MIKCLGIAGILLLGLRTLAAGDLPVETQAKFLKIFASSGGSPGKIGCSNAGLAGELGKIGMAADSGSKLAWASSEGEVKILKSMGKLVICGKKEWLPLGAGVAIQEEDGKPMIFLRMSNIASSGVTLSDAVLKLGRKD